MDLFRVKCTIVLLLSLTQQFSFAHVGNITSGHTVSSGKGSVNLVKASWINMDSIKSYDQKDSDCRNDVVTVLEKADSGQQWALQMLDATSKVPSGILMGNILDFGMYDECIGVKSHDNPANIQGRHCMVSFSIPSKFVGDAAAMLFLQKLSIFNPSAGIDPSLTLSMCVPSSCGVGDLSELVNASIHTTPELTALEVNVVKVSCSGVESAGGLSIGKISALSFFAVVFTALLFCTICEFMVRNNFPIASFSSETIAKFSLYTNAMQLLSTKVTPDAVPAIHGFRFMSTCFIVIGHRMMASALNPTINKADMIKFNRSVIGVIAYSIPRVVDTFLVLSGFLTAYTLLKALRSGQKINILVLYLHRYLRLTPCMVAFLLFGIFIFPELGSGPLWETIITRERNNCLNNWWTNLLYINNFVNNQEMCFAHTWYLAVEMHFIWICPIILYPLHYKPKLGLLFLGLLSITSLIAPAVQLAVNQWAAFFSLTEKNGHLSIEHFFNSYTITYNRALPYLIGILLGYDVVNNKRQVSPKQVISNWMLTCFIFVFCTYANHFAQPIAPTYHVVWEMAHASFLRLGWSLATAWILYACTQGYGGPLTKFLSLPVFAPLSRVGYCIYWVHPFLQLWTSATLRTPVFASTIAGLYPVGSDLAISTAIGFVLTLCFETPVIVLEKHFMAKRRSVVGKDKPAKQGGTAASMLMRNDSDVAESRICSDSSNEGKPSTRDIAKWTKVIDIWQEWKSDLLNNGTHSHVCDKVDRTESAKTRTGITSSEEEFLTFLTAVCRGSDEDADCRELEILQSARSLLLPGSYNLQDEDSLTKKTE